MGDLWNDWAASIGAEGANKRARNAEKVKRTFENRVKDSLSCQTVVIEGATKDILAVSNDSAYVCDITAMPGDGIAEGDSVLMNGDRWIIRRVFRDTDVYMRGEMLLCNQKFRFDIGGKIVERWGVLDSGVYSTTVRGGQAFSVLDKQYKVYLPYDDETKKLFVDFRFATGKGVDAKGREVLLCYAITGYDPESSSYGDDGHLLVLNARSEMYNPDTDSLTEVVCDYKPDSNATGARCVITGKDVIRAGTTRTYSATFLAADGTAASAPETAVWQASYSGTGITVSGSGANVSVTVADDRAIIGTTFTLSVVDTEGNFATDDMTVEVSA